MTADNPGAALGVDSIHVKLDRMSCERYADRIRCAESVSEIDVKVALLDTRLKSLETGMMRITHHSAWLLRLVLGTLTLAILKFTLIGVTNVG